MLKPALRERREESASRGSLITCVTAPPWQDFPKGLDRRPQIERPDNLCDRFVMARSIRWGGEPEAVTMGDPQNEDVRASSGKRPSPQFAPTA